MEEVFSSQLFPELPLNKSIRWQCDFRGLQYSGEVVLAQKWRRELGNTLSPDCHFRIVILTAPQSVEARSLQDPRIAVVLPGATPPPAETVRAQGVREVRSTYIATPRPPREDDALRAYLRGRIRTQKGLPIRPRELWQESDNPARFQRIASTLLQHAYPLQLMNYEQFPRSLTPRDTTLIYQGFFGSRNAQMLDALDAFSVGLGLAKADNPRLFAPEGCPVFDLIDSYLERTAGTLPVATLNDSLVRTYGFPASLATLYLLAFLRHKGTEVTLLLKPNTQPALASGERLQNRFLTPEIVPSIQWRDDLADSFDTLTYSQTTFWNRALPYITLLSESARPAATIEEASARWDKLRESLSAIGGSVRRARASLKSLQRALASPVEQGVWKDLERLAGALKEQTLPAFYSYLHHSYGSGEAFQESIALVHRVSQLADMAPDLLVTKAYLDGAGLPADSGELEMDRMSLLAQLDLAGFIENPNLAITFKTLFSWFSSHYKTLYQARHGAFHKEMAHLSKRLQDAAIKVAALQRLNTVQELGEAVEPSLPAEYALLCKGIKPCKLTHEAQIPLGASPRCPDCHYAMTQSPPSSKVEDFLDRLEKALRIQHRRLSSEAIRMILAQSGLDRIDQFIKITQSTNLSSLANAMDDELVEFLRRLLSEVRVRLSMKELCAQMRRKYGELDEEDIEGLCSELARLLHQELQNAKTGHPERRIRFVLEE